MLACILTVHFTNWGTAFAKELLRNLYVDDLAWNANSTQEGIRKCEEAKAILADAKMDLRGFKSNDPIIHQKFAGDPSQIITSILGITWNVADDCYMIGLPKVPRDKPVTKRFVLK